MQWQPHQYLRMARDAEGEEYVDSRYDEVLLVPFTAGGEAIFASEPSPAFGQRVLILPGGCIEPDEPPEVTANRELQEEIGFRAEQLDLLGTLHPYPKYLRATSNIYLARSLSPSRLVGDETHEIGTLSVPLARFEELITGGRLADARAIAALYLARSFLANAGYYTSSTPHRHSGHRAGHGRADSGPRRQTAVVAVIGRFTSRRYQATIPTGAGDIWRRRRTVRRARTISSMR